MPGLPFFGFRQLNLAQHRLVSRYVLSQFLAATGVRAFLSLELELQIKQLACNCWSSLRSSSAERPLNSVAFTL